MWLGTFLGRFRGFPHKNLIIYSEILTKVTQSTPYFRTSRYLGLRHPPNSPNHHSQSVAGWSCFFWLAFRKTGSLTTTWCFETKKHENCAFTLNLPVELAKCFLFLERCQKNHQFSEFFFFIGKIRPFKVLQCYQPLTFPHGVRALYLQLGTLFRCWQCGRTAATGRSAEERSVGKTLGVSETLCWVGWGIIDVVVFLLGGSNNA